MKIPVEVSARHCHLSLADIEKLFGGAPSGSYKLQKIKQLSQPLEFACKETVSLKVGSKNFEKVRVVGPERNQSQVEISLTDAIGSGVVPPLRVSGDIKGSEKCVLEGPAGKVVLQEGLIIAKRHIHCATEEAKKLGLKNKSKVSVKIKSARPVIFEDIIVRVKDGYKLALHLDTDEGNSAGIDKITKGEII